MVSILSLSLSPSLFLISIPTLPPSSSLPSPYLNQYRKQTSSQHQNPKCAKRLANYHTIGASSLSGGVISPHPSLDSVTIRGIQC